MNRGFLLMCVLMRVRGCVSQLPVGKRILQVLLKFNPLSQAVFFYFSVKVVKTCPAISFNGYTLFLLRAG